MTAGRPRRRSYQQPRPSPAETLAALAALAVTPEARARVETMAARMGIPIPAGEASRDEQPAV